MWEQGKKGKVLLEDIQKRVALFLAVCAVTFGLKKSGATNRERGGGFRVDNTLGTP